MTIKNIVSNINVLFFFIKTLFLIIDTFSSIEDILLITKYLDKLYCKIYPKIYPKIYKNKIKQTFVQYQI